MKPINGWTAAFALWCLASVALFAFANASGYAAFAQASRPSPALPVAGQHHK